MQTISESAVLRCIANCLETSYFYARKGNRPLADWWHDRADMYAEQLATYQNTNRCRDGARVTIAILSGE